MGAAHLNWAISEGTAHVGGSRPPPQMGHEAHAHGREAKGGRMAPRGNPRAQPWPLGPAATPSLEEGLMPPPSPI